MITINNKIVKINNNASFVAYLPTSIKLSNLKGWFKLESLSDVVLNFQSQTGTVSTTSGGTTVTGSGTSFGQNDVGKRIRINGEDKWISSVASTTSLTVDSTFSNTNSSVAYSYGYVSKWINSISGMPDFEQAITTAQPFIKLVNSKITVYFNLARDTDCLKTLSTYDLGTKQTFLFKCLNNKTTNVSDVLGATTDDKPRIAKVNGVDSYLQVYNYANTYPNYFGSNAKSMNNIVFCFVNNGNGWKIYNQNNIEKTIIINSGTPIADRIINDRYIIGNNRSSQTVSESFKGFYSELIIYNDVLTSLETGKLLHYLHSKKY